MRYLMDTKWNCCMHVWWALGDVALFKSNDDVGHVDSSSDACCEYSEHTPNPNPIPQDPPQGPPPPHQPKTTPKPPKPAPKGPHNLATLVFPIPLDLSFVSSTKNIHSPPSFFKLLNNGRLWKPINLNQFRDHLPSRHAKKMNYSQIQCLTLASCHRSWLKILSLRSIQMVQRVTPLKRCQI